MTDSDLTRDGVLTEELLGPLTELERRNAPARVYYVGSRDLLVRRPRVAVVGARDPPDAGLRRAESSSSSPLKD